MLMGSSRNQGYVASVSRVAPVPLLSDPTHEWHKLFLHREAQERLRQFVIVRKQHGYEIK